MNELLMNLTQGAKVLNWFFITAFFIIIFLYFSVCFEKVNLIQKVLAFFLLFTLPFVILFSIVNNDFKSKLKISLENENYFSSYSYKIAGNQDYYSEDFIVYKIEQKESKEIVYFNEKSQNGLELKKSKEESKIVEVKNVLFKTSCEGYSINQCVEKVNELLKDNSYVLKLNEDKVVNL